ncbi:GNAT family N-acetyltransferase [Bacillus sp. CGMCC 1.16607]|uniref:GNAT family N-acetyltransferase n=1 Tax=Bacillus sp. CGMCC 1.16607 TaxID=3351842 RepID=UPI0036307409
MKNITFRNIYINGQLILENDQYRHVHNSEMLLQYNSNFITFKEMPSIDQFKAAQNYLRDFHEKSGQRHVRFYFPEGETIPSELTTYLLDNDYTIGVLELYAIQPELFPTVNNHPDINIQKVSNETLELFLKWQFEQDSVYGNAFAEQKQGQHVRNYNDDKIIQIIAFYQNKLVGSIDVIIADKTAEMDGFIVHEDYQKRGIGSQMQKFVMELFQDKTIILVADGEDTAREMYRKQNYQYLGLQYESLRVYD